MKLHNTVHNIGILICDINVASSTLNRKLRLLFILKNTNKVVIYMSQYMEIFCVSHICYYILSNYVRYCSTCIIFDESYCGSGDKRITSKYIFLMHYFGSLRLCISNKKSTLPSAHVY